jgi:hypothetical protein
MPSHFKLWLRGIGIVLVLIGFMSFPFESSLNPERWTGGFYLFADVGLLFRSGLLLAIIGALIFALSFFDTRRQVIERVLRIFKL